MTQAFKKLLFRNKTLCAILSQSRELSNKKIALYKFKPLWQGKVSFSHFLSVCLGTKGTNMYIWTFEIPPCLHSTKHNTHVSECFTQVIVISGTSKVFLVLVSFLQSPCLNTVILIDINILATVYDHAVHAVHLSRTEVLLHGTY